MRLSSALRVGAVIAAFAGAMLGTASAEAAETASRSFATSGEHAFVVPAGVTGVQVRLVAGSGGSGSESHDGYQAPGGAGRIAIAALAVTPGETLFAEVAGNGLTSGAGGYGGGGTGAESGFGGSGGGGGGGASDVRTCPTGGSPGCASGSSLASRLAVAGGGGGGGGRGGETEHPNASIHGGIGGEGEASGGPGALDIKNDAGGTQGKQGGQNSPGAPGGNSTQEATPGQLGAGGNGGLGALGGGGGGGGGVFGGGGGGSGLFSTEGFTLWSSAGGGGGGGGSGVPAGASGVSGFSLAEPVPGAQPSVTFTWTLPPPAANTGTPTSLAATTATLNGTVNPDGSSVSDCHFVVSPAPPSGASLACSQQVGAGSTPVAVSAALAGLSPATTYTVTLVASSAQGSSNGAPVAFATLAATAMSASSGSGGPTISGLNLSPARFRRGRRAATLAKAGRKSQPTATTISFVISTAATVTLSFERQQTGVLVGHKCAARTKAHRGGRSCTRYLATRGAVRRTAHAGTDRIRFEGVLDGGRPLGFGTYRLSLAASAAAGTTVATQHPTFTLVR